MNLLHLDLETTSACDITLGGYRYGSDPTTRILMFAVAQDDEEPVLWDSLDPDCPESRQAVNLLFQAIAEGVPIYAHNVSGFELPLTTYRLKKDVGIDPPHIDQWRCTLAMCRRAAAPESLAESAKFFGLNAPKDPRGKALIGIFSDQRKEITLTNGKEKFKCTTPPQSHWNWTVKLHGAGTEMTVRDAWELFKGYCRQDVRVEQELHRTIKHFELRGDVLASFQFDLRMNWRGVPVNVPALRNAQNIVEELKERLSDRFTKVTGLQPTQRNATLEWLQRRGYPEDNLQSATVAKVLQNPAGMTREAVKALALRDMLSFAALAKIPAMIESACEDNHVKGTMQWHAARTGRAGGRIIQPQNFRKSTIGNETKLCYHMIREGWDSTWFEELWDSPLEAIASSIRHFIQRENGNFLDADFAAVEQKLACWAVDDTDELEKILAGMDMYKVMASQMFRVPYEEVTKEQRTIAKPVVLGCGYGVGARSLRNTLETLYRVKRTLAECKEYVKIYRDTHPKTVQGWRELEDAAKASVRAPGREFYALNGKVAFRVGKVAGVPYLTFRLPSGRRMYYPHPAVKQKFREYDEEEMLEEPWKREERGYWVEELSFYGRITGKAAWGRIGTFGSRLLENLCFTGESEVLTPEGWIAIRDLKNQPVFDGVEFVTHDGLSKKVSSDVIRLDSLGVTSKHLILTSNGWQEAQSVNIEEAYEYCKQTCSRSPLVVHEGYDWSPIRDAYRNPSIAPEREEGSLGMPLRLRRNGRMRDCLHNETHAQGQSLVCNDLPTVSPKPESLHELPSSVCSVSKYAGSVQTSDASGMAQLRSAWNYRMRKVADWFRGILGRHGSNLPERVDVRPHRQREGVFSGKLQVGDSQGELAEQTKHCSSGNALRRNVPNRNCAETGDRANHSVLPIQSWAQDVGSTVSETKREEQVFDILNCGPRNRFVIRAPNGKPIIAHNCQAMGADLLDYGCQQAEKAGFDIRMIIHDQILALEDHRPVEELVAAFCKVPEWAATFPQAASGDVVEYYTKD